MGGIHGLILYDVKKWERKNWERPSINKQVPSMKGYEQQCGNTCAQVAKLPWLSSQGAAQSGLSKCSATEAPYPEPPCGGAGNCKLGVGES